MEFVKYQALGNDYLVVEADALGGAPSPELARTLCDRHFGVGADGVLVSEGPAADGRVGLRILNPDGSEAEKSGNGLRIHARYLWDRGCVGDEPFEVHTAGGRVRCQVQDRGRSVRVEMGRARFEAAEVPVAGVVGEMLCHPLEVAGQRLELSALSLGNPHCVVLLGSVSPELAREIGPHLERHALFPNRTNVQLVEVRGRHAIRVEIWERGAGYTLASGSSACAAAAVCCRLGHCDSPLRVHMPGGELHVEVDAEFRLVQTGPVVRVAQGRVGVELLAQLGRGTGSAR